MSRAVKLLSTTLCGIFCYCARFWGFVAKGVGTDYDLPGKLLGGQMNHSKRHRAILTLLQQDGTVTIADLRRSLDVSRDTVPRDIKPRASDGPIVKMHGAISLPSAAGEAPFEKRMRENSDAKKAFAIAMAGSVRDGDSIMLDTGT